MLLPVGAVVGLVLLLLSCFGCYRHRWLVQGARRLCAPQRLRERCAAWAQKMKALASPRSNQAAAKTSATQVRVADAAPAANTATVTE